MATDRNVRHTLYWTALILVLVGAINLGILGLTGINLLAALFGGEAWLLRTIYVLIGLGGAYLIYHAARLETPARRTMRPRTY